MSAPNMEKLDPELRSRLRRIAAAALTASASPASGECFPDTVKILVEFRGAQADLEQAGVTFSSVGPHPDGSFIGTGRIKTARLLDLAAVEHVVQVDGGGRYAPEPSSAASAGR